MSHTSSNWYAAAAAAPKRDAGSCLPPNGFLHGGMGNAWLTWKCSIIEAGPWTDCHWLCVRWSYLKRGDPRDQVVWAITPNASPPCIPSGTHMHACPPSSPLKHCRFTWRRLQGENCQHKHAWCLFEMHFSFGSASLQNKPTQLH